MASTNRQRRGRATTCKTDKDQYGGDIATLDRMQEVWALRTRGYSFRAIGEKLGIHWTTAWRDCQEPQNGMKLMDDASIARTQLLQGHRILMDHLMSEIEDQRLNGQRIVERDANGNEKVTIKPLNHQMVAEAGRCLDRAARLLGLLDGPIDGSGSTTNTTIVLTSPSDGASFEQKWANADAAVDVTAHSATEQPPEAALSPAPPLDGDTPA